MSEVKFTFGLNSKVGVAYPIVDAGILEAGEGVCIFLDLGNGDIPIPLKQLFDTQWKHEYLESIDYRNHGFTSFEAKAIDQLKYLSDFFKEVYVEASTQFLKSFIEDGIHD